MPNESIAPTYLLWLTRITAALLFILWGAFFLAHLKEWFIEGPTPPTRVWIGQALHLLMVVGLAVTVFNPVWGAALTFVGTVAFFASIGMAKFPYISLLNGVPILLAIAYQLTRR